MSNMLDIEMLRKRWKEMKKHLLNETFLSQNTFIFVMCVNSEWVSVHLIRAETIYRQFLVSEIWLYCIHFILILFFYWEQQLLQ